MCQVTIIYSAANMQMYVYIFVLYQLYRQALKKNVIPFMYQKTGSDLA